MKKWSCRRIFLLLIGMNVLFLLTVGGLYFWDIILLAGPFSSRELAFFSACLICVLLPLWATVILCRKADRRWKKGVFILILIAVLLVILVFAFALYVFRVAGECYTFSSPDAAHTVVVEHRDFFFSSWGTVYEQIAPFAAKKLGSYSLGDAYSPEYFGFTWLEEGFIIDFPEGVTQSYFYLKGA